MLQLPHHPTPREPPRRHQRPSLSTSASTARPPPLSSLRRASPPPRARDAASLTSRRRIPTADSPRHPLPYNTTADPHGGSHHRAPRRCLRLRLLTTAPPVPRSPFWSPPQKQPPIQPHADRRDALRRGHRQRPPPVPSPPTSSAGGSAINLV
jgi:hypothetical protein